LGAFFFSKFSFSFSFAFFFFFYNYRKVFDNSFRASSLDWAFGRL
jgi:hypothetical protein